MLRKPFSVLWVHQPKDGMLAGEVESLAGEKASIQRIAARDMSAQLRLSSLDHHAVVFDLAHPNHDDFELLRNVREKFSAVPTVLLTSNRSEVLLRWVLRLRIWDVLYLPCSAAHVCDCFELIDRVSEQNPGASRFSVPVCALNGVGIPPQIVAHGLPTQKTAAAVRMIENKYGESITLCEVARRCGMSSFELSRVFKREQGVGFREYLLRTRIAKAKALLVRPENSVLDVMVAVGFSHASYFSRIFRRYVGVSPGEYRRQQ